MLRFFQTLSKIRQGLLLLTAGLTSLIQAPAYGFVSPTCSRLLGNLDSLGEVANVSVWLGTIRAKIPYFYFDPLPQIRSAIDDQLVERAKMIYRERLELLKNTRETKIIPPKTNEEKIALLEVIAEGIDNAGWAQTTLVQIRKKREKDFIKAIDRWRVQYPQLTQGALNKLFDLYYLETLGEAISWSQIRDVRHPSSTLLAIARERWKAVVARESMAVAFDKLGFFRETAPWSNTLRDRVDRILRFSGRAFINLGTFMTFHVPSFFPQISLFNFKTIRQRERDLWKTAENDSEKSEADYFLQFKNIQEFDYFKSWAAKTWPYVLTAVLAVNTFSAYNNFQKGFHLATNLPSAERTESRVSVEQTLTQSMLDNYQKTHGGQPAPPAVEASIRHYISGLKLREQLNLRDSLQPGS